MAATVTTGFYLDVRSVLKNTDTKKVYPVKLRVTFSRDRKYYSLTDPRRKQKILLTLEDFKAVEKKGTRGAIKEIKIILNEIEARAIKIISELPTFSFAEFDKRFRAQRKDRSNVFMAIDEVVAELEKDERIGTAVSYRAAGNSLKAFYNGANLVFSQITQDFLKRYEKWMLITKRNSKTTVGIYLRAIRAIINRAISEGVLKTEAYPFGLKKYQIPSGANIKKALVLADVGKIFKYKATNDAEEKYKDYWCLSYLWGGLNTKDIALLKGKNIDGDSVEFTRAKTENTRRKDAKPISHEITALAREIITRQGQDQGKDNYLFPILQNDMSAKERYAAIQQFTKMVNQTMEVIRTRLGIEKRVTTMTARHSYSTVSLRAGIPVEFISGQLGHSNISTTQNYLDSFDKDTIKANAAKLTDF